ncbi:MAG: hypothetical protein KR126chlam3_01312 [Chlamydiae bacterium]|nr:hypothetical protein [Chlamydiota bacterium]
MSVAAALGSTKLLLGHTVLERLSESVLNEISGRVALLSAGGYLGLKLAEKGLGLNKFSTLRRLLLSTSLVVISRIMFHESFAQNCSATPQALNCPSFSYLQYTSIIVISISISYFIYKFRNQPTLKWKTDKHDVVVFSRGTELRFDTFNRDTNKRQKGVIEASKRSIKEQIEYMKKCEVVVSKNGAPFFSRPLLTYRCKEFQQKISLLRGETGLVWQIYNKANRDTVRIPFYKMTYIDPAPFFSIIFSSVGRMNAEMKGRVESFKERYKKSPIPAYACVRFLEDFYVHRAASLYPDVSSLKKVGFCIELFPRATLSCYGDHVITEKMWCVSLICANGSNPCGDSNHAEILIEKLKQGIRSCHVAHLTRRKDPNDIRGRIKIQKALPTTLRFTGRTQFWVVPKWKVKKMLAAIKEEKPHPPKLK